MRKLNIICLFLLMAIPVFTFGQPKQMAKSFAETLKNNRTALTGAFGKTASKLNQQKQRNVMLLSQMEAQNKKSEDASKEMGLPDHSHIFNNPTFELDGDIRRILKVPTADSPQDHLGSMMADRQVKETYILNPGETKHYVLKQRCDLDELARIDYALGYYYHAGVGVKRNYDTAIDYYRSAAQFGNSDASFYLGKLYYYGSQDFQLEKDDKLSAYYMQMAAEKGHTDAKTVVGDLYMNGIGVEKDSLKAIGWYKQAAEAGNVDAQYALAYCYYQANDNDSTILWGTKPLCRMYEWTQYLLGNAYYDKSDHDNAELWWKKAAKQNNADACWELACLYVEREDSISSFTYLKKAAELGHVSAIGYMGVNYFNGYSVPKDEEKGIECFKTAAVAGDANACLNLGTIYYWKDYGRKNYQLAAEYWRQGAELGSPDCQYNYGMLLKKGRGVRKDKTEAIRWLKLAADNGLEEAKEEMKKL